MKKTAILNEIKQRVISIHSSQVSSEGKSEMLEAEGINLFQLLLQSKVVSLDKLMEILQANSSADGFIKQDDEGVQPIVSKGEEKEFQTTMKHMKIGQAGSYRGQDPDFQLSMVPKEQPPRKASTTGY